MNDPNNKYNDKQAPAFFNYHEFLVPPEAVSASTLVSQVSPSEKEQPHELSLVVNHFPNVYAPIESTLYKDTRIVRIPRAYHEKDYSYMIPQFSLYTPGEEPAAVLGEPTLGSFDWQVFSTVSKTPLVPSLLSASEVEDIVKRVNAFLADAFSLNSKWTWVDNMVDFFTGTLYSRVWGWLVSEPFTKRQVQKLDEYVEHVNETFLSKRHPLLRLIAPRESGFLSLDFQIPKPSD
ncbi:hypothetical protein FDK38_002542 [Candidozyma auris]|nr:hypothetical protein FDK38_002542 [[Candida] auris]